MKRLLVIAALAFAAEPALAGDFTYHGYDGVPIYDHGAVFIGAGPRWGYHPDYGYGVAGGNSIVAEPAPMPTPAPQPPQTLRRRVSPGEMLAQAGANREEQRKNIWNAAQAFCKTYPDGRMCNKAQ
jgi:hypothetical protein